MNILPMRQLLKTPASSSLSLSMTAPSFVGLSESQTSLRRAALNACHKQAPLTRIPYRQFSKQEMTRAERKAAFEQKQREKEKLAPQIDESEFSFQGKYIYPKAVFFTAAICLTGYWVHLKMSGLQDKKKARIEGLTQESQTNQQSHQLEMGGDWVLKDLKGRNFGSKNLEGNYYLLYFGFSLCPDVCPISLMKMSKAIRKLQRSSEGKQYIKMKGVFVSVNPEVDTPQRLHEFCQLFDSNLVGLREESSQAANLQEMLRKYKVPAGLTEYEREAVKQYFDEKIKKTGRLEKLKFWKKKNEFDPLEGMMNDHSKVFYLMAPDNKFLAFYKLDIDENELAEQMVEDISYDMGTRYIGTGKTPPVKMDFS